MGGTMSRNKGKRGEREIVNMLQPIVDKVYQEFDREVPRLQRNTLQSDGGGFDIVGLEWLALEVKFQESFNLNAWWAQTSGQANVTQTPVLIYRRSRVAWRVRMMGYLPAGERKVRTLVDIELDAWLVWFETQLRGTLANMG